MQVQSINRQNILEDLLKSNTELMRLHYIERKETTSINERSSIISLNRTKYHQYKYYTDYLRNLIIDCKNHKL